MELSGSNTERNLQAALTGESLARNKYTFYAMAARKAGYDKIAEGLERMAQNEMMHAKFWFEKLHQYDDIRENLLRSINDELSEANNMYPKFAEQARAEGMDSVAAMFESVARIEQEHARQFTRMLQELEAENGGPRLEPEKTPREGYRCMFCGAVFPERPDVCDVCQAIGSFEVCQYTE